MNQVRLPRLPLQPGQERPAPRRKTCEVIRIILASLAVQPGPVEEPWLVDQPCRDSGVGYLPIENGDRQALRTQLHLDCSGRTPPRKADSALPGQRQEDADP